jgi:hypothetical protein
MQACNDGEGINLITHVATHVQSVAAFAVCLIASSFSGLLLNADRDGVNSAEDYFVIYVKTRRHSVPWKSAVLHIADFFIAVSLA